MSQLSKFESTREVQVIAIEKGDVLANRATYPRVASSAWSSGTVVPEDPHAGVRHLKSDRTRRTVIHDDYFEIIECLRKHGSDRLMNQRVIANRENH